MRAATSPPHLVTLILLTGNSVLTLNMFLPSLPHMAEDFDVSYGLMSIAVGGYLLMTAVTQLVIGSLSDRYGRRPVILSGLAIFIAASVVCALTENFAVFIAARLGQSASATGMVLSRAIIRDQFDDRESAAKMATVAMIMAIAPMLGPTIGGVMDAVFGWRASFVFYALCGVAVFALCWVDLGETHYRRSTTFGAQFREYPELFRSRRFWGYAICASFSVATFHIFVSGAPLVVATAFGMGPAELGLYMGTITLGFIIGSGISSRVSRFYQLSTMMIAGRLVAVTGLGLASLAIYAGHISVPLFFGAMILSGMGNGMTAPNANAGVMSIRPHIAGSASGLSSAMIVFVGALTTTLTGALVDEVTGTFTLTLIMTLAGVIGLVAALSVRAIDLREGRALGV
ncbi:drug resistance transporter, Bcr/CflA subfamily protein [Pseudooceanicola batsensis HTCC2597]|uniref:Bcr/CflA family efflux transporter n=1 Tax=Pseudooceanicola batsensis (strain ATCC BAA-863 / DSM 15984 / KCTC 12145 / HTCC2597) TaxID=252305 RepID=A3U1W5_PSEBH|nr:multidrug effflux MFS transporter [Pseudooceanicola batsensis]EAQ01899.1 drug resistance transporter, Bcr/CflA subfamily protein [Pseudooceanicola batsensis HTCC2597]